MSFDDEEALYQPEPTPSLSTSKKKESQLSPFVVPAKSRSQIEARRLKEMQYPGYDDETESLENKGYKLIQTTEHFTDDGTSVRYEPPNWGNSSVYHQQLRRDVVLNKIRRRVNEYWTAMPDSSRIAREDGLNV